MRLASRTLRLGGLCRFSELPPVRRAPTVRQAPRFSGLPQFSGPPRFVGLPQSSELPQFSLPKFGALLTIGALALCGGAHAQPSSTSRAHAASASHLQVTQVEYRLILSRGVVRAGRVSLQAIDAGMDPHDLRLRDAGAKREIATPELTPGRRWDGVVDLKPGSYHLWCSLPEHAKLGMHATLRVVR